MFHVLTQWSVSVHGGGYHRWEVTADELVKYMKVCSHACPISN